MVMPVPIRTIYPEQLIAESDFTQKQFEVSAVAKLNFVTSFDQMRHEKALGVLAAGKAIPTAAIGKASDVRKGQVVAVRFVGEGIEIQGILAPLRDGLAGQVIPCKNPSSGLIVDALVMADGTLSVSQP